MKKRILSVAAVFCLVTMMLCSLSLTASAAAYPSLENVTQFDMREFGVSGTDLSKEWAPIGNCTHTMNEEKTLATVTPNGTQGYFYGPASEFGGDQVKNVALAMTFGIKFKDGANDFGAMLILKGQKAEPSWTNQYGIVLMFSPDKISLGNIEYGTIDYDLGGLNVYNGTLDPEKNYNLEFIATDTADGKTDAYVKITDENGKVLADEGNKTGFTVLAKGIEGSAEKGWVTLFGNDAQAENFRFGTGRFIPFEGDPEQEPVSEPEASPDDSSEETSSAEDTSKEEASKDSASDGDISKGETSKGGDNPETGAVLPLGAALIGLTAGVIIAASSKRNGK